MTSSAVNVEAGKRDVDALGNTDTRVRILDTALDLFAEHGFAATSTRELSERLGFTKAALYYHFRTKDDLLAELVRPVLDRLAALAEGEPAPLNRTARRELLAAYVRLVADNRRLINTLAQDPSAAHRPALTAATPLYDQLSRRLAGHDSPGPGERTRIRAALGGIHAALMHAEPTDPPAEVEHAALAAACGAIGIPGPRPSA
jgi:AcrR family transcriptional regulator